MSVIERFVSQCVGNLTGEEEADDDVEGEEILEPDSDVEEFPEGTEEVMEDEHDDIDEDGRRDVRANERAEETMMEPPEILSTKKQRFVSHLQSLRFLLRRKLRHRVSPLSMHLLVRHL